MSVTLEANCEFTLPTVTSDSSYHDGYTYLTGNSPVTLTFSGFSATCAYTRYMEHGNGNALESTHVYTQGSTTDTLTFFSDDPAYENTRGVRFYMESTEVPGLLDFTHFSTRIWMTK